MSQEERSPEYYMELLRAVEHAVDHGTWEETLFLKAMGKELRSIRDELRQSLNIQAADSTASSKFLTGPLNLAYKTPFSMFFVSFVLCRW